MGVIYRRKIVTGDLTGNSGTFLHAPATSWASNGSSRVFPAPSSALQHASGSKLENR
jgi:hypothetical protein